MNSDSDDDLSWLVSERGQAALADVEAAIAAWFTTPAGESEQHSSAQLPLALVQQLHNSLQHAGWNSEERAALITQAELRRKATAKFPDAAGCLFFTPAGLQQATRSLVARYHAHMFAQLGARSVLDAGAGIGADSRAFALAGLQVTAVELDQQTAALLKANLADFPHAQVIHADSLTVVAHTQFSPTDAIWMDPMRRDGGRRMMKPEQWIPPLSSALSVAGRAPISGIKVAPGIAYADLPTDACVDWVSVNGDLVEAVIWRGPGITPGRRAIVLTDNAPKHQPIVVTADASDPTQPPVLVPPRALDASLNDANRSVILDPDPAIIRSGAISWVAQTFGLAPTSHKIAYLAGQQNAQSVLRLHAFGSLFDVLHISSIKPAELRTLLRQEGSPDIEVLERGVNVDTAKFRKALLAGTDRHQRTNNERLSVILTPILGRRRAVIARRILRPIAGVTTRH
ncbi:MAG: hypothetical protein SPI12_03330 [Actinomycetaceae bacterium]|nr:rRNA adenine N-6-methyltransferase family protein [Actinomycetaceae bacterium]MDY6082878.1 hypothetical protein [Actinomycetaceae bacterium]